jgi:hypothetical protein
MSISNITSADLPYVAALKSDVQQRNTDFKALGDSLSSGDLQGAQQAYAAIGQDQKSIFDTIRSHANGSVNGSNLSGVGSVLHLRHADYQALGQALANGDLAGAQQAFAAVQADQKTLHMVLQMQNQTGQTASSTGADTDGDNDGSGSGSVGTSLNVTA